MRAIFVQITCVHCFYYQISEKDRLITAVFWLRNLQLIAVSAIICGSRRLLGISGAAQDWQTAG
jgi:hypothetical protein